MKKTTEYTSAVTPRAAGTRQSWTSRAFALLGILGLASTIARADDWWKYGEATDGAYLTGNGANWGAHGAVPESGYLIFNGCPGTVTFNNVLTPNAFVWVGATDWTNEETGETGNDYSEYWLEWKKR